MLKKVLKKIKELMDEEKSNEKPKNLYALFAYTGSDGRFDYEKYKSIQIEGNKKKIESVWVLEENIQFLSQYIKNHLQDVKFGLCHGTRRGKEQEWFRKYLDAEVLGTEISDTANQFPHTIQWDFHEVKDEWVNNVDFIYSNSFDHSYDPKKCLDNWMKCVSANGICILEHTSEHVSATELDPFGADVMLMPYLVLLWGEGKYCVTEILEAPAKKESLTYTQYLVIRNFGKNN